MKETLIQTIKEYAPLSEAQQSLHPELLELAYQEGWFKLFVPPAYGGPGKTLPEILRLEEAIAAADGSLGWTVTLCSGAGWFAGFLDPTLAKELFADEKVCFAGSGEIGGTARRQLDGYLVSGSWRYASGAMHATVFTANCILQNADGSTQTNSDGSPVVLSFILKKEEINIIPGWSYFGLVATGSHAFEAKNIQVSVTRSFTINDINPTADLGLGFDYPFLQMAETTLAVNLLGMSEHFTTLVAESFEQRSGMKRYTEDQVNYFYKIFKQAKARLDNARTEFYEAFDLSWKALQENTLNDLPLAEVSNTSRILAHMARAVCDQLYPFCGLNAARKETTINRVWRDIHTASQHALLTFPAKLQRSKEA